MLSPSKKKEEEREEKEKKKELKADFFLPKDQERGSPVPAHNQQIAVGSVLLNMGLMRAYLLPILHLTVLQYDLCLVLHQVTVSVTRTGLVSSGFLSGSRRGRRLPPTTFSPAAKGQVSASCFQQFLQRSNRKSASTRQPENKSRETVFYGSSITQPPPSETPWPREVPSSPC